MTLAGNAPSSVPMANLRSVLAALVLSCGIAAPALAVDLSLDGSAPGPATCPLGGTPVDRLCSVNATPAANNGCRYGGEVTFGSVSLTNGAVLCVAPYDGVDKNTAGNLVVLAESISIDATSQIIAKGSGYRGILCNDGEGPSSSPLAGGRGGCAVLDSGGGGAHFGSGGIGTKDCFLSGSSTTCDLPQEAEEDCGDNPAGIACVTATDPNKPVCYGTTFNANGSGDGSPVVAGFSYEHSVYDVEFGAAGGDKGCRDAYDSALRAGRGGGRIVLFAATPSQDGVIDIAGAVNANGQRGCASGNDSAGGGAGGSILIVGDTVNLASTAQIGARGGRGGDSQPKCLTCTTNSNCQAGQICVSGRCSPCNCTPCTSNAQCDSGLGQTCKILGGDLGQVCADATNRCTPLSSLENENECLATQNSGTCDDCGGGGGGGIIVVQARSADIDPLAALDVSGGPGGICPACASLASGAAGSSVQIVTYEGEVCDGADNDFDDQIDEDQGTIDCGSGPQPACVDGEPQACPPTPTPTVTPSPTPTPTYVADCPAEPATCASAGKSSLAIKRNAADPSKNKFTWKWGKGVLAASQGDFGDPLMGSPEYRLCIYDQSGGNTVFKLGARIAAGNTCGTKPCWKRVSDKGWAYANKATNADGISKLSFKGGVAGKPAVVVAGKGTNLPLPAPIASDAYFDLDTTLTVQLHATAPAACWSSTFTAAGAKKNDAASFSAKNP